MTKRLAGMQPYFFPYLGYWQLIQSCDCFVLFDDAQYISRGWINRNRILKSDGGWQYIVAPLKKHSSTEKIKNLHTCQDSKWKELIMKQLQHYRRKAACFDEAMGVVEEILFSSNETAIARINYLSITALCRHLGLEREIILSSEQKFDYSGVHEAGDWALRMSEQLGATETINPISGAKLFDLGKFSSSGIDLRFLESSSVEYSHVHEFKSSLSIIDLLMFRGIDGTKRLLSHYRLVPASESAAVAH